MKVDPDLVHETFVAVVSSAARSGHPDGRLHPFVCQRGVVSVEAVDRSILRSPWSIQYCFHHSTINDQVRCCVHPVVSPGLLAAYKLGGPDAVASRRSRALGGFSNLHRAAYDDQVFISWSQLLNGLEAVLIDADNRPMRAVTVRYDLCGTDRLVRVSSPSRASLVRRRR